MRLWRLLAKPVRVALIITTVLAALIPLSAKLDDPPCASGPNCPEWFVAVVFWAKRAWLPAAVPLGILLAAVFGVRRLYRSWRQPAIVSSEARADTQQLGQWLLLALCGACLGLAPLVTTAKGVTPSSACYDVGVLGMGLCISALTAADFLGLVLVDRLNDIGFVSKAGLVALWTLHFAGPLIFPLAAYQVARRAIVRHPAETAAPAPVGF